MELKAKISAITGAAKEEDAAESEVEGAGPLVNDQDIANIVSQWTGIPIEKVLVPLHLFSAACASDIDFLCVLTPSTPILLAAVRCRIVASNSQYLLHMYCEYTSCIPG